MCPGRRLYRACRLACLPAARARRAVSFVGANRHDPGRLCTAVSCAKQMLLIYTLPPRLDLHERGVRVQILTGKLAGTYSPVGEGKFFFTMMAASPSANGTSCWNAPWPGLLPPAAKGRAGWPTVMDADKRAAAHARRTNGESPTSIAKALGVSRASIYRHLARTDSV